jgi:chromosome partitioning protein
MRTIAVVNQKGGCGKTITSINLSAFLALERRRVLLVDMDPQGHATLGLIKDSVQPAKTMYDVFLRDSASRAVGLRDIARSVHENLDVAPSDILLSAVPEKLAAVPGRENILSDAFAEIRDAYDYVIVDCPPNVGVLTFNALKACAEAIVPVDPSFFSLHGIGKLLETFAVLATKTGHEIVPRVVVTLYSGRTPFVRAVVDEIRKHLDGRYFETIIRHSVKLAEAASHGVPIAQYCTRCAGFVDYQALAAEVMRLEATRPAGERVATEKTATAASESGHARGGEDPTGPSAPITTRDGVLFTLEAPGADRVQVAGDFNQWVPDGSEMAITGGVWKKLLRLRPGRYRYRYVVDGCWRSDPLNADVEPSPFGGHNSVLVLDEKFTE